MTTRAVPANAAITDQSGQVSRAWLEFLRNLGRDTAAIGDFRQTSRLDIGGGWLLCNGSAVSQTDYPALFAIMKDATAGGGPGMFKLPNIPSVYDPDRVSGNPVLQTWVRAL